MKTLSEAPRPPLEGAGSKTRILWVQHNSEGARLLQEALADSGNRRFELARAHSVDEALTQLGQNAIHAVLLDLTLPGNRGLEGLLRIREKAPQVPVVVWTALDEQELAVGALQGGAQDYIVKGQTNGRHLVRAIGLAIERHRMHQACEQRDAGLKNNESRLRAQIEAYSREMAKLARQLEEKIQELSVVRWIGDSLKYAREIRKVFEVIIETIIAETSAEDCSIMLLNRDAGELAVKAIRSQTDGGTTYYAADSPAHRRFRLGEGVAGWVAQQGEPASIPDTAADARFVVGRTSAARIGSILCFPLVVDGVLVGVINLSHPNSGAFSDEDDRLMNIITGQLAIALNNVQIFEDLQNLNALLEEEVKRATLKLREANQDLKTEIAERKRMDEALRKREADFRELYDEAPVGYLECDTDGRITRINRTALKMLGYAEEEMLGRPPWEFILEQDASRQALADKLAGSQPLRSYERTWRRRDGALLPALMEDLILRDDDNIITGIRATLQDITAHKKAEEAMTEADRLRVLIETAGAAAHEINQPLTVAVGLADVLLAGMADDDPKRSTLKSIQDAAMRISKIVQNMQRARRYVTTPYAMGSKIVDFVAAAQEEEGR